MKSSARAERPEVLAAFAVAQQVQILRTRCAAEGHDTFLLGPLFRALEAFEATGPTPTATERRPVTEMEPALGVRVLIFLTDNEDHNEGIEIAYRRSADGWELYQ